MVHTSAVPARPAHGAVRLRVALVVAVLTAVAIACGQGSDDGALAGIVRDPPLDVASVQIPAADDGRPVAMQAAPRELLIVYFGYTSCPDICPTTMSDLSIAVNDLPDDLAERVTVAFVTVDPERDSAEVLTGYIKHFFDDGLALRTEDGQALATAAAAFGVQYEVADHESGATTYDVAHTAVTYVVDDGGKVVVEWPFGFMADDMTSDLRALLEKERT